MKLASVAAWAFPNPARAVDAGQPGEHLDYRSDIDGLRAVAVLLVVGFHAFPGQFGAGFVGVDIFFVISGFLISSIILKGLDAGSFTFAEFYGRRVRRIFPALLTVLAACFAVGWFGLFAGEFAQLGKHIAAGAAFVSNIVSWSESGYFDAAAQTKPLLHLWSLGVEEQFYILWPLMLWAAHRTRVPPIAVILACAAASFAAGVWLLQTSPTAAFYSPQARFWELLAGAFLACAGLGRVRSAALGAAGAVLLAGALLLIDRKTPFPGWWAALPVGGTAMLLAAGAASPVNRLLSFPPLVWVGRISYPLYLWHWPLLSFAAILYAEQKPAVPHRLIAIGLAFLLAALTYWLVESPIRRARLSLRQGTGLASAMAVAGVAGLLILMGGGLAGFGIRTAERQRFAGYFEDAAPGLHYQTSIGYAENSRDRCNFYDLEQWRAGHETRVPVAHIAPDCFTRDAAYGHAVFVWGDSHAQHLYAGLRDKLPRDWQILQVASSACPPSLDRAAPSRTDWCAESNGFALQSIARTKPDVVVLAQSMLHDAGQMVRLKDRLLALGAKRVVIVGPTPHWLGDLPNIVLRRLWPETPRRSFVGIDRSSFDTNDALRRQLPQDETVVLADATGLFCNGDGCLIYLGDDRMTGLTSWDYGHLTPPASDYLAEQLLVPLILNTAAHPVPDDRAAR